MKMNEKQESVDISTTYDLPSDDVMLGFDVSFFDIENEFGIDQPRKEDIIKSTPLNITL